MKNVILYGMMGAGKTTVGAELARLTGRRFVDTDALIEEKHGKISDIFNRFGEAHFRALEEETAGILSETDGLIISVGGGVVLRDTNVAKLKKNGKFVYLRASVSTLLQRLKSDESRPLLRGGELSEKLENLQNTRGEIYQNCADIFVDTDGKKPVEIAEEILRKIPEEK